MLCEVTLKLRVISKYLINLFFIFLFLWICHRSFLKFKEGRKSGIFQLWARSWANSSQQTLDWMDLGCFLATFNWNNGKCLLICYFFLWKIWYGSTKADNHQPIIITNVLDYHSIKYYLSSNHCSSKVKCLIIINMNLFFFSVQFSFIPYKVCSRKFRSRDSSNLLLSLLRNFLEQSLIRHTLDFDCYSFGVT